MGRVHESSTGREWRPSQQHDVGRRVGADAGELQEAAPDLLVGQFAPARREEDLEVELAAGDARGDVPEVRAAVAGTGDVPVEAVAGGGHRLRRREGTAGDVAGRRPRSRLPEPADQGADHPLRRRPGAVGRADGLDHVLEDRRAAQQAPGAACGPRKLWVPSRDRVEAAQVVVQAEHAAHGRDQGRRLRLRRRRPRVGCVDGDCGLAAELRLGEVHRPRPARRGQRDRGGPRIVGDVHRWQLRDAVRAESAAQVDGLAAGAAQPYQGYLRHAAAMRATPASVAAAPASWCGAMRSRRTPNASSTVTTG